MPTQLMIKKTRTVISSFNVYYQVKQPLLFTTLQEVAYTAYELDMYNEAKDVFFMCFDIQ